jgi:Fic family protein
MGVIGCIFEGMVRAEALQITPETLTLIAGIDEFKGTWRSLGTLAPERLSALRRVATVESIGSSTRIEGSKLTDREVERLLMNLKITDFSTREEQEVAGYAELMELIFSSWQELTLTENHIKQLHRDLLRHSEKDAWHRGEYKSTSNRVAAFDPDGAELGVVFEPATPFDTPRLMTELVTWVQNEMAAGKYHPLLVVGIWAVVFLEIHPFQDGNGRLSRALTTLLLLRAGYAYVPFSSLESVIERNKEAYYLALRRTQSTIRTDTPDWEPWLLFFLRSLQGQVHNLLHKLEREKSVLARLPAHALTIVEFAREHGRITMREAILVTGASRNTLKEHFRTLVGRGHLNQHGEGRGAWYDLS